MSEHLSADAIERLGDGEWGGDAQSEAHLASCAACANAVLSVVQMKRAIAALPRRTRPRRVAKSIGWLPIAAALGGLAILGGLLVAHLRGRDAARELVDMHATIVAGMQPVDVLSTDRHTVKPWFEGRVPFAVDLPDLAATPFRVTGGRVIFWRGKPGAYILLTKGAHRISLMEFIAAEVPRITEVPHMTLVQWQGHGLAYIAIADIPRAELEQLRASFHD